MVPNAHPVFIDLGNGSIQGTPVPATGNEIPSLRVTGSAAASTNPGVRGQHPDVRGRRSRARRSGTRRHGRSAGEPHTVHLGGSGR